MEWWGYLAVILGMLTVFFLSGLPIAFCFTLFNFIAIGMWMGGYDAFALLTGSAVSGVAVLGSTLAPEMRRRGYSKELALGPILGSGCLAMIIPPSVLAVLLGSLGQIPVGALLISGIVPGL